MKQILFRLFENLKQLGIKPNIGSRTNVTPIPGSEIDRLINRPVTPKEFDYSKPEVVDSMKGIIQNASDYVGQFTERQLKTFNDNVERILGVVKPKEITADVVDLATKEKITGPGLESLMKEKGVASISKKTIEAETLIKQFLDDDLISLNAKQIDQLSRGKAEDVFENIFGSKAKELITGKNTNESLNEVYNKLKTTKDTRGRLPDDPNFDPSDINFKDGGSVSEDVKKLLKEEFIELINEDPESFPDTNSGFRRFLKRKGSPVFNYKEGGKVKEPKQTDAEIEEEIRENKKELLSKKSLLPFYKGNTLFGLDLDFSDKNIGGEFGQYNKKDIKDPRIGLSIIPNVQDDTSSRWGISIGPKGGGITFMKPFSQIGLSGDWEEVPESWYEDNIPDVNVLIPELPEMKNGGKVAKENKSKAEEPLSKYKSYSENELLSSLDAKMPNLEIVDDELVTMPKFEPRDVVPKGSIPVMPVEEYLRRRFQIDLADGGEVKSFEEKSLNKKGYETEGLSKKEIFDLYDSVMGTFSKRYKKGGVSSLFKKRKRYADGGVASMFRKRPGYADGGNAALNTVNGIPLDEFLKINYQYEKVPVTDKYGNPTFDNSGRQNFTATVKQEYIGDNPLFDWNTGKPTTTTLQGRPIEWKPLAGGWYNVFTDDEAMSPTSTTVTTPTTTTEIPTVDPFSGQQVLAQDQAAFTQPQQNIFSQQDVLANIQPDVVQTYEGQSTPYDFISSQLQNIFNNPAVKGYSNLLQQHFNENQMLKDAVQAGNITPEQYNELGGYNISQIFTGGNPILGGLANLAGSIPYNIVQSVMSNQPWSDIPGDVYRNVKGGAGLISPELKQQYQNIINPTVQRTVNVGSADPGLQALGRSIGSLDFSTMNALRNNADLLNTITGQTANMAYGGRVSMSNGGLTNTIPPARGPNSQGVESLFTRRYN